MAKVTNAQIMDTLNAMSDMLAKMDARVSVLEGKIAVPTSSKKKAVKGKGKGKAQPKVEKITAIQAVEGFTVGKAKKGVEYKVFYETEWNKWIKFRKELKFANADSKSLANSKVSREIGKAWATANPKA